MRFEMVAMEPDEFAELRGRLPVATAPGLFDTYRISQTTWYKLRDGRPVKRNTIEQLRARYRQIERP